MRDTSRAGQYWIPRLIDTPNTVIEVTTIQHTQWLGARLRPINAVGGGGGGGGIKEEWVNGETRRPSGEGVCGEQGSNPPYPPITDKRVQCPSVSAYRLTGDNTRCIVLLPGEWVSLGQC